MKQLILALAVAAMAISCSKNESKQTLGRTSDDAIMLSGTALSVETRAPFAGNTLTAYIPASLTTGDYSTRYADGSMTFTSGAAVGYSEGYTGEKVYPANAATKIFLVGLYPATNWATISTSAAFTFTGKEDVMAAPEVTTTKADASDASYKKLSFGHKLAKIEFSIVAENTDAIAAWGEINEIMLTKNGANSTFANMATVTLASGSAAFTGTAASWPTYEITGGSIYTDVVFESKSITLSTSEAKVAYTMVVPVMATGTNDYTLSVKATPPGSPQVTVGDIAVNLKQIDGTTAFTGTTAGNSFTVALTFKALHIKATASATDWVDAGGGDVELQ